MGDAQFLAYPPVVAAGNNANVIHYINNTQVANDGELVLMDAGVICFIHFILNFFFSTINFFFVCKIHNFLSEV